MERKRLVIGTYEIETQFCNFEDYLRPLTYAKEFEWLDTAITYNNDYFIKPWKGKIISKISPSMYDSYDWWVENHLKCLGRSKIDVMLVHNTRNDNWLKMYLKLLRDSRFIEVGVSNVTVDDLKEIHKVSGKWPVWVETEINPNYCDLELVQFCKSKGIKVIAYAIFGGKYNARRNISRYTIPVILNSVLNVADLAIVRWDTASQLGQIFDSADVSSINVSTFIDWDMVGSNSGIRTKSIVPDKFSEYPIVHFDKDGFPIFESVNHYSRGIKVGLNRDLDLSKFKEIGEIMRLEFPTEYAAMMRYQHGRKIPVAILDSAGSLTKVMKRGNKVYAKL